MNTQNVLNYSKIIKRKKTINLYIKNKHPEYFTLFEVQPDDMFNNINMFPSQLYENKYVYKLF
jgi:hypothetical protein